MVSPILVLSVAGLGQTRCCTNAHDNSIYWYFEPEDDEWTDLDELRFLHGYAHQFIWDADNKVCEVVNMAE